jgi:hypothetical protein
MEYHSEGFVGVFENFFTPEECQYAIDEFERIDNLGLTWSRQDYNDAHKMVKQDQSYWTGRNSERFNIREVDTGGLDHTIGYKFNQRFWEQAWKHYAAEFATLDQLKGAFWGIKMQRTIPTGGYHIWHYEKADAATQSRVLAFILYLNDIEEGGETELLYQSKRFKPKQGKLIIFPCDWTHTHRGNPPLSQTKYILTGWMHYANDV